MRTSQQKSQWMSVASCPDCFRPLLRCVSLHSLFRFWFRSPTSPLPPQDEGPDQQCRLNAWNTYYDHAKPLCSRPRLCTLLCMCFSGSKSHMHALQWCNMVCAAVPPHLSPYLSPCLTWKAVHTHSHRAVFAPNPYCVMILRCCKLVCKTRHATLP